MARLLVCTSYLRRSFLALGLLEGSSPSADTYFDTERRAFPQPAAFLSRRTRITPSTHVYTTTPFVSDLVLVKSVAVGKMPRQTLIFDRLLYWPHIAWARTLIAIITKPSPHYVATNRVHHFQSVTYIGSRPSPEFLHSCEIKSGSGLGTRLG